MPDNESTSAPDLDDQDLCPDCGQIMDVCECHVGDECGRWRNGRLTSSCSKAGSEECDFECPHRNSLYRTRGVPGTSNDQGENHG